MTATHDYRLPFPPNQVWNTLPSAVQHTKKATGPGNPTPDGRRYTFSTRISLRTFGFTVFVDLHPLPQGTHMRVSTSMNFGLIDWGEGRDIANELHLHLTNLLQAQQQGWRQHP
ncbi:hypothetical protein [Nocardiopsis sp. FIRDI 009]|uniref:hypothetical protein n=1 Tax=Nocardiopsis sp. FIRDI 009 TaxID=714197 RepID=UPI000E23E37C|nr:hypothetical protein [Nocardiopsis sp. FIRDI 009]